MADAISGDIAFHFTVSGHTLTIRPGRGVAKVERQGRHVELYGGITEPIEDAALSEIPWGPGVELMVTYKGAEVLRGKTSVRVTAGRSVQVVGAVELDGPVHCPVIRIVKRSEVLQYGYAVGRFERLDAWVPRGLVWCLSS